MDRVADKSGAPSGFAECGREALPLHETGEVSAPISDACKNGGEAAPSPEAPKILTASSAAAE